MYGRFYFSALMVLAFAFNSFARQTGGITTPTRLSDYFENLAAEQVEPDADGFIRRWTILEPVPVDVRSNVVFTDSYLNQALDSIYFEGQMTAIPADGDSVTVGDSITLRWHSLDSKLFNCKLYRLAAGLKKPVYGVLFFACAVIDCDDDIGNVRLAAGSNSASKWWLDGEEVLLLSGDRRMVADDGVSKRLALKKGKHVLRCAVINGPGMSDFCARFINETGNPVKNLKISYK